MPDTAFVRQRVFACNAGAQEGVWHLLIRADRPAIAAHRPRMRQCLTPPSSAAGVCLQRWRAGRGLASPHSRWSSGDRGTSAANEAMPDTAFVGSGALPAALGASPGAKRGAESAGARRPHVAGRVGVPVSLTRPRSATACGLRATALRCSAPRASSVGRGVAGLYWRPAAERRSASSAPLRGATLVTCAPRRSPDRETGTPTHPAQQLLAWLEERH